MGSESDECCRDGVILGVDGGTTSTICVCLPLLPFSDHRRLPDPLPVLGRAAAGCSNHNSVGEYAARVTLEQVIAEALSKAGKDHSAVLAVCLGVSVLIEMLFFISRLSIWFEACMFTDDCHSEQDPMEAKLVDGMSWNAEAFWGIFPHHVKIYVQNDAVAALASGTMGKLHGCVLIAGTGCIAYGFTEDGREARAAGAGPVLGDWGSGYGIASRALTAVVKAHDGRGPKTTLTNCILESLGLPSPDEIIGWTYADSSWARIAALVPIVVSCAEAGDEVAEEILNNAVHELALSVKAVVKRLDLAGKDGTDSFPVVMVGGVLEANKTWDIGSKVIDSLLEAYPGACPIRPKDHPVSSILSSQLLLMIKKCFTMHFIPQVEPAIGAALFAWDSMMKETEANGHR
ncbi:N-acetyl-D-glucosamine kinase [Sesamum angolense]|uniref:N-acetyl-D-glucosamine kinase n=1 Tax=Sesamum angolense TaxID=2727404 RepID=A0AAE2BVY8_9LAMI|nr:N-acetyl-D-glucosamine kinase [Sesamum angolense]